MLANIYDFYPDKHIVIKEKMILLDQWAVDQAKTTQEEIIKSYKKYDFHTVIKQLMCFCSITMGSFYLDIIKDRQYTLKKNSKERRSCQTAMYYIIHALVRWIAPILSFTADEIWKHIPGNHAQYVFTEEWFDKLFNLDPNHIFNQNFWNKIIELKNETNKFLEIEIKNKHISHSLEACIILYVLPELKNQLEYLGKEIKFIFLTSEVKIKSYDTAPVNAKKSQNIAFFKIFIEKSTKKKCQRCWHYTVRKNNTSINTNYICTRCIENTIGNGEKRSFI
jgi:isoleucyl-tRNA synthetase